MTERTATPGAVTDRMRRDWNRRAEEDYKLHIATGHAGSDEAFRTSGGQDLDEVILDGIELSPEAEALEIGCGVGRLLVPLSERIRAAHGADISEVMIRKSKEYAAAAPNVKTSVTDGTLTSFMDASLDLVYSFIVFQHIPAREPIRVYVEEAARVLKPGGLFRFQVDGRWRERAGRKADTYDGVTFSPVQVRELLAGTPFEILEEWGEGTHYHRVTVRRTGAPATARVRLRPSVFDLALLAGLFRRAGVADSEGAAGRVARGDVGLRDALGSLETKGGHSENDAFVREVYRVLLGREPDREGLAFHLSILGSGFEDRASLVDTILTGAGFRERVRPVVPDVPWFRAEDARRLLGLPDGATFFDLVDAAAARLEPRPPAAAVGFAFELLLGRKADPEAEAYYAGLVASRDEGRRLLVRELLGVPDDRPVPAPPENGRVAALAARVGVAIPVGMSRPGESFAGEALVGARLLDEGASLSDGDFVHLAYERVLGREADADGEAYYTRRLAARELSRATVLRELLWSGELRRLGA